MNNICEILNNLKSNFYVKLYGWIRNKRYSKKNFLFLSIYDGSYIEDIQIIISENISNFNLIKTVSLGSSIKVCGFLVNSFNKHQKRELYVFKIKIIGLLQNINSYPLISKKPSFEYLRKYAHLRVRTKIFSTINRIRNNLFYFINNFLYNKKYAWISTPILTSFLPEEDVELFHIFNEKKVFFKKKTSLTISSQLALEAFACGMKQVYSFGPVFRAENSDTNRHLAEFWMLELESAFLNFNQIIIFIKIFLKNIFLNILFFSFKDILFLQNTLNSNLISRILNIINKSFYCISYKEAINILIKSKKKFLKPIIYGINLTFEHEEYLSEIYFKQAIAIILYPQRYKPFYMKYKKHYSLSFDIIFPFVGELIGGSEREENYLKIKNKLILKNIDIDKYTWYLNLRKYGTVFHSGFGLGFERILMYISGIKNIKDVIPFPRVKGNIDF